MKASRAISLMFLLVGWQIMAFAQFSPGELSKAHSHLEGTSNCTQCHDLGARISDKKCLACHTEINTLIVNKRGYHSSTQVKGQRCTKCHSEHHGKEFDATRFDQKNFNHDLAGYKLQGKHNTIDCKDCHKSDHIKDGNIKKRAGTFLGLSKECLICHDDYHQGTLNKACERCHGYDKFTEVPNFSHDRAKFALRGAHRQVNCADCHKKTTRNGKNFQQFTGLLYSSCADCHHDPHENKFGTKCTDCHSENAWKQLKSNNRFNHAMTKFPLMGQHSGVACEKCHKNKSYNQPIAFEYCRDCHSDYHQGDFREDDGTVVDCKKCHSVEKPFSYSSFGIDEHKSAGFVLDGAHVATPCIDCHKESKDTRWSFNFSSINCVSCHQDKHADKISSKYYPEQDCKKCHSTGAWSEVNFDHASTKWPLQGKHASTGCRVCHFRTDSNSTDGYIQVFQGLSSECASCHVDVHAQQFEMNGKTDCSRCHSASSSWGLDNFNHNRTKFPLTGKHEGLECNKCHKPKELAPGRIVIEYKIKNYRCIDCH